ncbi:MAG TPA: type IV toxin-antitoxin system AbiEi family antitoxin domain-containing protein [Acidimicrobiales bacterium]|nr:type IV toxin-antitoxin system AbiEi family antitoxin domain-containing protein [Acidimicrobiales bacterium]
MALADRTIAVQASTQLGLISMTQARAAGLTPRQVKHRLATGTWVRVVRGVYRLAGVPPTWQQLALAPCLAHPDLAVVSLLTASRLHGLQSSAPLLPDVTVPMGQNTRVSGATTHRARLTPLDTVRMGPIPVTTVERTLVDCAAVLGPVQLQRIVDAAMHSKRTSARAVDAAWDRSQRAPGRWGHQKLLAALEDWREGLAPDTAGEVRLIRVLRQWGFPEPERQIVVFDPSGEAVGRVDLGWSTHRVGLEYDSERWHGPERWNHDERRHQAIEALGWTLLHADKADLRPGQRGLRQDLERIWPSAA